MALMIMAAVIMVSAMPALADINYSESQTYYMNPSRNSGGSISVWGLTGSQSLKKANVKSSAPSVVKLGSVSNYNNKTDYYNNNNPYTSKSSTIYFSVGKPGTSTISFKIGSKTYKSKVKVLKYVNPLSSLTVTGVNGGKTIHTKFNKKTEVDQKVSKSISNANITVKAKNGWAVTYVNTYNPKTRTNNSISNYTDVSSLTLKNVRIPKDAGVNLYVTLQNKSNGGNISLELVFR